ncbi:MAG TPA: ABC transporter ATP-binding protein [Acidimicrobiales bacterium]|nr:ABC transporter ATP-binding protein [Acidimicrobiales bacterium]
MARERAMTATAPRESAGSLACSVRRRLGTLDLAVDCTVGAGTTLAVVGPNGAGKTTLLRIVAGLLTLDAGHVRVGDAVWDAPAEGRWLAPEHRSVGFVFQDGVLFPHLSVGDNVAFGLRCRGVESARAAVVARDWLGRVGLADRFDARPGELSGGQAQRVALARALAYAPDVLLLDEPLSALDARVRGEMRAVLADHLASHAGVRLLVTHDPTDARALGDRILVLEDGRVTQQGTPDALEPTGYLTRLLDAAD